MATETVSSILGDFEEAALAEKRVAAEIDAVKPEDWVTLNYDAVSAASLIIGVCDWILTYRDRIATLPDFEMRNVDRLKDYTVAAWFIYITNLPVPEPAEAEALIKEVEDLKAKFLLWATPLAVSGFIDPEAITKIKEGSGNKDTPSDVVALVALYRGKWDQIRNNCAVTEEDLQRAALIAPRAFSIVSQREQRRTSRATQSMARVRSSWTLAERAYEQCYRAIAYFRHEEGDVDTFLPNLRANRGNTRTRAPQAVKEPVAERGEAPAVVPTAPAAGEAIGNGEAPFATKVNT